MNSTPNPTPIDPPDIPTLAPEVVVRRMDYGASKPPPQSKTAPSAPPRAAAATAGVKVPPVDATFRAASIDTIMGNGEVDFSRRLIRGVMGMTLTACLAGSAVLLQYHGEVARQMIAKWAPPFVAALLSPRPESPAVDQPSTPPAIEAPPVSAAPPSPASQSTDDKVVSTATDPSAESAQLLQSMARDLADLRQNMEQMKAGLAELKASQEQLVRRVATVADKASDKAAEQNLRRRASLVPPPPGQPVAAPAHKPLPRPAQPRAAAVSYLPRQAEPHLAPPPPQSTAAPPTDLSAPPAPPREQAPLR